ncbi:DUF2325 domain-containing protein [Spirochaeta cellobiosiphila]|uniref:DUF2325 domain-containing protein n=1 Tax=Spirochaeta cellobiosiphila TaxID=504483 RepID=UPI0004020FC8|nr:DUF2325 domain-containing protein [Spirochaeta cellobiosiphila]
MRRKNILDIDRTFHCSIIGTCLSIGETKSLLEKTYKVDLKDYTDYQIHSEAVKCLGENSKLNGKITNKLNQKFAAPLFQSMRIDNENDLLFFWEESFQRGDIAGAYWSLLSHPHCTEKIKEVIFGEVHMMSHKAGADIQKNKLERISLKTELSKTLEDIKELKTSLNRLQKERNEYFCHKEELIIENQNLKNKVRTLTDLNQEVKTNNDLESQLALSQKHNQHLKDKLAQYKETLLSMEEYNKLLQLEWSQSQQKESSCQESCPIFGNSDLQGKKVLLVGGRLSMIPYCKSLVESMNGEFTHHDGGLEQSFHYLKNLTCSADVVVCALDCVSHGASHCLKKYYNDKLQKLVMLKNSGLTSFATELKKVV